MKKIVVLAPLLGFLAISCTPAINIDALKAQLREELKKDQSVATPPPKPSEEPSAGLSPAPISNPTISPLPTASPVPTPTPYMLPQDTAKGVKDALEALYTLESTVNSGVSYTNYPSKTADAHVAVDRMQRQTDFQRHPSASDILQAMKEFDYAQTIWSCYFSSLNKGTILTTSNGFLLGSCTSIYKSTLTSKYGVKLTSFGLDEGIYLNDALSAIWNEASKQLKQAQGHLNSPITDGTTTSSQSSQSQNQDPKKPYISGIVTAEITGKPVIHARIVGKIEDSSGSYAKEVFSDSNGRYVLDGVPMGGNLKIYAQKTEGEPGYCYYLKTLDVKQTQDILTLNIPLSTSSCN